MKRNTLIFMLAMLLSFSLIVSGCGSKNNGVNDSSNKSSNDDKVTSDQETDDEAKSNFNETGLPIVNEQITLSVVARKGSDTKNYGEMELVKQWIEDTNINIEWETFDYAVWDERISMILVSNDLPDVFFGPIKSTDEVNYAKQGYWQPLQDLISKNTVNLKSFSEMYPDLYKSLYTSDGNIYSLPRMKGQADMDYPHRWFINNKWLKALDLNTPDTLEDFETVLEAFKTQDPNGNGKADEIPFAFRYNPDMQNRDNTGEFRYGLYGFFGTFGRVDDPVHIVLEDGKPLFTADKEEYKEAVKWMRKAMENGWIDEEAFTMDTATYKAKNTADDYIYGVRTGWTVKEVCLDLEDGIETYSYLPPLTNVNDKKIWPKFGYNASASGYFYITKDNEYPTETIRWIDYFSDPYISLQHDWGIEGLGTKINEDGTWEVINGGISENRKAEGLHWNAPTNVPKHIYDKCKLTGSKKFENDGTNNYTEYAVDMFPRIYNTDKESEELAQLTTDICNFVSQKTSEWIFEGGIDEEWDNYVKTLEKMGLKRYVEIYTEAYTRYNS